MLMRAARDFAQLDNTIDNTEGHLKKMEVIAAHLKAQNESMKTSVEFLEEMKEQVAAMQR